MYCQCWWSGFWNPYRGLQRTTAHKDFWTPTLAPPPPTFPPDLFYEFGFKDKSLSAVFLECQTSCFLHWLLCNTGRTLVCGKWALQNILLLSFLFKKNENARLESEWFFAQCSGEGCWVLWTFWMDVFHLLVTLLWKWESGGDDCRMKSWRWRHCSVL